MHLGNTRGTLFRMVLVFVLTLSLIVAFGLHTIQVEHVHHGEHGGHYATGHTNSNDVLTINEFFHATEQKFYAILFLLFGLSGLFFVGFTRLGFIYSTLAHFINKALVQFYQAEKFQLKKIFIPRIYHLFHRGLLHPKVY